MYRVAAVSAFDMLSEVHVSATVRTYDSLAPDSKSVTTQWSTTVSGTGEDYDAQWLREALLALLELL